MHAHLSVQISIPQIMSWPIPSCHSGVFLDVPSAQSGPFAATLPKPHTPSSPLLCYRYGIYHDLKLHYRLTTQFQNP